MNIVNWEWINTNQDCTAQSVTIGLLLTNPELAAKMYGKYASFLRKEHFTNESLGELYEIIGNLIEVGEKPTPYQICKVKGWKKGSDEFNALVEFLRPCGMPSDYKTSVSGVVEEFKKYRLLEGLAGEIDWVESRNSEEVLANLRGLVEQVEEQKPSDKTIRSVELGDEILKELGRPKKIYPTGISKLDNAMSGGLVAGKMYGFCARKKTGKTVLAATMSYNLAKSGVKSFFMACEMSKKEIHQRSIARDIGRNCGIFLYKDVVKFEPEIVQAIANDAGNMYYHDGQGITFKQLKIELERAVNLLGAQVFILDYIQLIGGRNQKMSEAQFMDEVSQWLAEFCLAHEVVGVVIAQMNQMGNVRGGEGIRLACSQCYELKRSETQVMNGQKMDSGYYLEMMDTRYTPWMDIGTEEQPELVMDNAGPHFREI